MNINIPKLLTTSLLFISLVLNASFAALIITDWGTFRLTAAKVIKPYFCPTTKKGSEDLNKIGNYIDSQNFSSESKRIDFVRNWVHENSTHKISAQHEEYAFNTPRVLSMLWKTHLTEKGHAHLSCGPRAMAMKSILDHLKIQSRIVAIFTDDYPQVESHTFLEVLNKETGRWEIQDPDLNIYYIDRNTLDRIATLRLIFVDLDSIVPISTNKKGWKANNVEDLKRHYFEALMYVKHLNGEKSVILINSDRFDAEKRFHKNENVTFYQFANKHYGKPTFIENQGF
jgi:hypothetical protein